MLISTVPDGILGHPVFRRGLVRIALGILAAAPFAAGAQHKLAAPGDGQAYIAPASDEAEQAIKRFTPAPGLKVDLWAAEPLLANPVAFNFDEKGRAYVCETFRLGAGVDDIRGIMDWLNEELASRTVDERLAEMKRHLGNRFVSYTNNSERIELIEDRAGQGKADHATVFAEHFNSPLDGIGAGVLARKGKVWYADIPNLWLLRDTNGDGVADMRRSLHYGFGVRVGFLGHDLHGLHFGPDGKIYFSIGDRGSNIKVAEGRQVGEPDMGCVFRCNPDGSDLEVFAYGLRNPQDLVFDQYGNLFTGDNNSDSGDEARWVYLVEGSDNGWRVGYQFMENPYSRGPFNAERLWYPPFQGQPAYIVPPVANIASGPSGVAYFPGTGLPSKYQGHFFLVDFRGGPANSGVHTFTLQPKGAGYELVDREHFLWGILATDVKFGVDGGLYVSDWVEGWGLTGKGRLYRVHDPGLDKDPLVLESKRLLAEGMEKRSSKELSHLLEHADMRVRQEAQFELAARDLSGLTTLVSVARQDANPLARLHGIWGLGQVAARYTETEYPAPVASAMELLVKLLSDRDPEVRAQSAKTLGDRRYSKAFNQLIASLEDSSARTRFFAAIALGKLGRADAYPALFSLLRHNVDQDPYIRHAGVMGLSLIGEVDALMAAARDESSSVRMGVLLALRRLQRPEIAAFVHDPDPALVLEAARAINDVPINGAMHELATLVESAAMQRFLGGAPLVPESVPRPAAHQLGLEALLRRVLNANFHFGTPETATALAAFAARAEPPEDMRVEALEELADWEHPAGIDRVVGLWRPVGAVRHKETAASALEPKLGMILRSAPEAVQVAALHCVTRLEITNVTSLLTQLVADTNGSSTVRAATLSAISRVDLSALDHALSIARNDADEDVRKAAMRLESRLPSSNPVGRIETILKTGTPGEKQNAFAALATLPSSAADDLIGQWLDRLRTGSVPKELQLDLLDAAGKRSNDALKEKLAAYEAGWASHGPLAPYEACLFGGNAEEGKRVFFEKPEAQCVRCHRINGQGGDVGPDLSHVGSQKDRRYLLESVVLPNQQIAQGFDSVTVVLKDGDVQAGVLKSETPTELVLHSADNGAVTIKKADIKTRKAALSPMPEGLDKILSKDDLRNLVEFLSSRK
ncbi:MAG TPA: PVC-type heme-binding CxxCH protein [Verrucomicrobiae bacterium]|nr:PVC-type heme-binding CxxCH protein [Verrucomicrobiae bacterium]